MKASVEVASVEASVDASVKVASVESSVEVISVEAFVEASVGVASVEAFMEASTAWKRGSFHGSFHELPPKMKIVQVAPHDHEPACLSLSL